MGQDNTVRNDCSYRRNYFIAVLSDDRNCPFWIERLTDYHKNGNGVVSRLSVHLNQVGAEAEIYTRTYSLSAIQGRRKVKRAVVWESSPEFGHTLFRKSHRKQNSCRSYKKL